MPKYRIEVQVKNQKGELEWLPVRPTNGSYYKFDTEDEAARVMRMFYPSLFGDGVRVKEVQEGT